MSNNERGLGRGLDALFRHAPVVTKASAEASANLEESVSATAPELGVSRLPLAALKPAANQPRKYFDDEALEELAASIQSQGVVQPLLVRPVHGETSTSYEIIAGERRWRASQLAGLTEVPVYIRNLTDEEALTAALIENLQREDLNPLEEAQAIQGLRDRLAISQEELATKLGKSRSAVANALRLLQLPASMQEALRNGTLTPGHARSLLSLTDAEAQEILFTVILERHLSVRDAESAVAHWKRHGVLPFTLSDADEQGVPVSQPTKNARIAKPACIKIAIQQLRDTVHPKASIAGTESMGRITLPYESPEQLAEMLQRLGLDAAVLAEASAEAMLDEAENSMPAEPSVDVSQGMSEIEEELHA